MMLRNQRIAHLTLTAAFLLVVTAAWVVMHPPARREVSNTDLDYVLDQLVFYRVGFDALPGWQSDDVSAALAPFLRSCELLEGKDGARPFNVAEAITTPALRTENFAGTVGQWRDACALAMETAQRPYANDRSRQEAARRFFEAMFSPVLIAERLTAPADKSGRQRAPRERAAGKVTGYFEPSFPASKRPTARFSAPLHARPEDLVMVNLQSFDAELAGKRLAGYVEGGHLKPYATRADINRGALGQKAEIIAYMDPTDLFFLQIQGSGRIYFSRDEGGHELRVGYDGQNGRQYYAIGRALIENGSIPREKMSMQAIEAWLRQASPDEAARLRERNPSYVFFRVLEDLPIPDLGPLGAQGVQLTAGRSLAVDRRYHGLGAPIYVVRDGKFASEGTVKETGALFIAQDVGGAIKGPLRGDIYVGSGTGAGEIAGQMNDPAVLYALLPKQIAEQYPFLDGARP